MLSEPVLSTSEMGHHAAAGLLLATKAGILSCIMYRLACAGQAGYGGPAVIKGSQLDLHQASLHLWPSELQPSGGVVLPAHSSQAAHSCPGFWHAGESTSFASHSPPFEWQSSLPMLKACSQDSSNRIALLLAALKPI